MPWTQFATVFDYPGNHWSIALELPGNDQLYYMVAVQEQPNPVVDWFSAQPRFVLAQGATNLLYNSEAEVKTAQPLALTFVTAACEDTTSDTLDIPNHSSSRLTLRSATFHDAGGVFTIDSAIRFPLIIEPLSTARIPLHFHGGGRPAGPYLDTLRILTDDISLHDTKIDIPLVAVIDSVGYATSDAGLDFGRIDLCSNRDNERTIVVRNTGTRTTRLQLPVPDVSELHLLSPLPGDFPFPIAPGDSMRVTLRYEAAKHGGRIVGNIRFSLLSSPCATNWSVPFTVVTDTTALGAPPVVEFGLHGPASLPARDSILIWNTGTLPLTVTGLRFTTGQRFRTYAALPLLLQPGAFATVLVEFDDPDIPGRYSDDLILDTEPVCATLLVPVRAERAATAMRISVEDASAAPGDTVQIRVRTSLEESGTLDRVLRVTTSLRFDASLLYPLGSVKGVDEAGVRTVPLQLEMAAGRIESVTLLPFQVMLGRKEETMLLLGNSRIEDLDADVVLENGRFLLTDICREGGTRLVDASLRAGFVSISPQPAESASTIVCRSIERGVHRITLHDLLGRTIAVLFEGKLQPGEYRVNIVASRFAPGAYFLVNSTPTSVYTRLFSIRR